MDEFSYYFETRYNETDSAFPDCNIDRPSSTSGDGRMGIVNHMLHIDILGIQIPNRLAADETNSVASIDSQASICKGLYGRAPNVVLVSQNSRPSKGLSKKETHSFEYRHCSTDKTRCGQLDYVSEGDAMGAQNALNGL